MNIASQLTDLVGNTPMLRLQRLRQQLGLQADIIAKLEYFNPAGSAKDRIALAMIEEAERSGQLGPGGTVIEPTSGNTGVGLAFVCDVKGYRLVLTMPETMSVERRRLLQAYGVQLELTPGAEGMNGAIARARELCRRTPGAIILQQFENRANPQAHYRTTAEEIARDCAGMQLHCLVAGVGTGGTLCGTARRLKELMPALRAVAVEPALSPVLSGGAAGAHALQGIGAGFVPRNYDPSVVDEVLTVGNQEAMEAARLAARCEGLLMGISSGAALCAAIEIARRPQSQGHNIAVVLPDNGERYLSTPLFQSSNP